MKFVGGVLAAVAVALVAVAPAGAAPSHNLTDPVATGCASDSQTRTIATFAMTNDQSGQHITNLEVRYSPLCQTNWVRVFNPYPSGTVNVITSIGVGTSMNLGLGLSRNTGYQWSQQVYAPGSTCVHVAAQLSNPGHIVAGGGPAITVC